VKYKYKYKIQGYFGVKDRLDPPKNTTGFNPSSTAIIQATLGPPEKVRPSKRLLIKSLDPQCGQVGSPIPRVVGRGLERREVEIRCLGLVVGIILT